jgi:hypothetical protein
MDQLLQKCTLLAARVRVLHEKVVLLLNLYDQYPRTNGYNMVVSVTVVSSITGFEASSYQWTLYLSQKHLRD